MKVRFPLNGCFVDRDLFRMGALWSGKHPCHHILHRGVSFPPTNLPRITGSTCPIARGYSPCQAKRRMAPRHSMGDRCPAFRCHPAHVLLGPPPHSPTNVQIRTCNPSNCYKKGPGFHPLNPDMERDMSWFFPEP